ncbi:tyrosine-protein phosphatase non-receptor type 2-like isoform X2 [Daphnia pulex]|uniref:tyrosine-protein phosphatase non-receptor type 2-like isoform X2 n=1 Tax=Daphnia pulex TaxID=6669 RepID=UPI001EDCE3DD|nr:tyrosine-protein phosphatase non-receptor type 2-like isoform X2 [Daphnia pulex]XP_046452032.1 tyrosine-protein phosphatase non-receptor type 2-like isoform X2 [Daphnia pulex]
MECDYGVKDEYQAIESRRGWQPLFTEIREKSANFSIAESKKVANRDLNRYRDVNPFDHSRIVLRRGNCSYINASLVKVQAVERTYILTQGPLPSTVSHFWTMVWEQNCKIIAMLNNIIEKNQVKCHTYWPVGTHTNNMLTFEDVQLTVELVEEEHKQNYILRTLRLVDLDNEEVRLVRQYHYTTWPDFGVPTTPSDFIQYLQDIRNTGGLGPGTEEEPIGPAIVHCSAGIGRSGTFCIVDTALLQLERGERVNVKELLLEMRRYRMGLIQTAEQLRFSYLSIIEGAESMNIDLRRWMPPHIPGSASCSDSDSDSEDDSDNPEEVEEEDDVVSSETVQFNQTSNSQHIIEGVNGDQGILANNDAEELPPPIPPRAESLMASPDYDRPLPLAPSKRGHEEMEVSTASETEEDPAESDSVVEEAAGSECERKRRKQAETTIPSRV